MSDVQPVNRPMPELHLYVSGSGFVALVHQHLHESGLVKLAIDDYILPLLYVDAHSGNELCVFAQYCLSHIINSSPNVFINLTLPHLSVVISKIVEFCIFSGYSNVNMLFRVGEL